MQALYSPLRKVPHSRFTTKQMFKIGGSQLNESLEKVTCLGPVSVCVPQSFENLVGFPPIAEIVQVDRIQIVY